MLCHSPYNKICSKRPEVAGPIWAIFILTDFFLKENALNRAEEIFREYGEIVTFVCRLLPEHFAAALLIVAGLSLLAALGPALRAGRIEPSEVIREV